MRRLATIPAVWYLAGITTLGAVLRFWNISRSSIWHDEGYTMMLAPMSAWEIIWRTARDVHPPLYYLVLHFWMQLFGTSELAARGLSAVFLIAAIPVAYLLVRRLWNERAARLAALFVALGPFLVRYSQEARMYGMVAFLLLLATYWLVRGLQDKAWKWWALYAVTIAAALYTHYYAVFMILVHWIYVASYTQRSAKTGLWNPRWWVANVGALALFLPWVPSALHQFMRVQASFWIPKPTGLTLPNTLLEMTIAKTPHALTPALRYGLAALFIGLLAALFVRMRAQRRHTLLMAAYCLLGPVLVVLLSYKRPIYVDRYFVFASVALYSLFGIIIAQWRRGLALIGTGAVSAMLLYGVGTTLFHTPHRMATIGAYVNAHFQPGDEIVSGELYTFFDFSYYNHTGAPVHLWSKNGVNGYGESSLIFDRSGQIVVRDLRDIHPQSGTLWMVGKPGKKDYYTKIPADWRPVGGLVKAGSCSVQQYYVPSARGASGLALQ